MLATIAKRRLAKATNPKPSWHIIDKVPSGKTPDDRPCPGRRTRTRCAIALFLLLTGVTVFAQSGARAAASPPKKATPHAAAVLPPGLDDIESLTTALHKGESETTTEFEQRMAQASIVGKMYAFARITRAMRGPHHLSSTTPTRKSWASQFPSMGTGSLRIIRKSRPS